MALRGFVAHRPGYRCHDGRPRLNIKLERAVMRIKSYILCAAVISLLGMIYGCAPGKRPFMQVQLCLRDAQGLSEFTRLMQSVAKSEGMKFIDGSEKTKSELTAIHGHAPTTPIINLGVEGVDGVGLMAGDLGVADYQVSVGFSEGSSPAEAHRFADTVVNRLKTQWHVDTVPAGKGAFPVANCAEKSEN